MVIGHCRSVSMRDGWIALGDIGVIFQDDHYVACKLLEIDHIVVTANNKCKWFEHMYILCWSTVCLLTVRIKHLADGNFFRWRGNFDFLRREFFGGPVKVPKNAPPS